MDHFAEIPPEAIDDLTRIPDICLFQQICPSYENFEHLVIELKRPTLTLTLKELDQIRDYALTVADNPMFDKTRTKWHFILLGQDLDQRVEVPSKIKLLATVTSTMPETFLFLYLNGRRLFRTTSSNMNISARN